MPELDMTNSARIQICRNMSRVIFQGACGVFREPSGPTGLNASDVVETTRRSMREGEGGSGARGRAPLLSLKNG